MSGRPIYFDPSKPGHLPRSEKLLSDAALADDGVDLVPAIELETPSRDSSGSAVTLDAWALREWILLAGQRYLAMLDKDVTPSKAAKLSEAEKVDLRRRFAFGESGGLFAELRFVATALSAEKIAPALVVSPEDRAATLADLLKICEDQAEHPLIEKILQHGPTCNLLDPLVQKWGYDTNRRPRPIRARDLEARELAEVIRPELVRPANGRGRPRTSKSPANDAGARIVGQCQPIIEQVTRFIPGWSVEASDWFELFDLYFPPEKPDEFNDYYRRALQLHRDKTAGISEKQPS